MPFKKGNSGKPKGAETHVKKEARALFMDIMEGQVNHIEDSLEAVRKKDSARYLEVLSKLMPYFIPKKLEVDTPKSLTINVCRKP